MDIVFDCTCGREDCWQCQMRRAYGDQLPQRLETGSSSAPPAAAAGTARPGSAPAAPGALERLQAFAQAMAEWTAAGCPRRTPEQAARVEAICRANQCGRFRDNPPGCNECGCTMNPEVVPLTLGLLKRPGKWSMATTYCPLGLWDRDHGTKHWGERHQPPARPRIVEALVELKVSPGTDGHLEATFQPLAEQPAEVVVSFTVDKDPVSGLLWITDLRRLALTEAPQVIDDLQEGAGGSVRWSRAANPYYQPAARPAGARIGAPVEQPGRPATAPGMHHGPLPPTQR